MDFAPTPTAPCADAIEEIPQDVFPEDSRQLFAANYPEAWGRIQQRRRYMIDVLGIKLKPEVLPFSNIPAYLPPFWLAPQKAMRVKD